MKNLQSVTAFSGLAVGLALMGATALGRPAQSEPKVPAFGVRGVVEKVTAAAPPQAERGLLGQVEVAGKKEADTESDRAVVLVTKATRILRDGKAAEWADLKQGVRLEAKFKPGPRILIYPPRVEATEIRLLK